MIFRRDIVALVFGGEELSCHRRFPYCCRGTRGGARVRAMAVRNSPTNSKIGKSPFPPQENIKQSLLPPKLKRCFPPVVSSSSSNSVLRSPPPTTKGRGRKGKGPTFIPLYALDTRAIDRREVSLVARWRTYFRSRAQANEYFHGICAHLKFLDFAFLISYSGERLSDS